MTSRFIHTFATFAIGISSLTGLAHGNPRKEAPAPLSNDGQRMMKTYEKDLETIREGVKRALPKIDPRLQSNLERANKAVVEATAAAEAAKKNLGAIDSARGLVGHAKNKWIRDADRGIEKATAALKDAKDAGAREAAKQELANWEQNRKEGLQALEERQAKLDNLLKDEAKLKRENEAAQAVLTQAQEAESAASNALLDSLTPLLGNAAGDSTLAKGFVLASATPEALARAAEGGADHASAINTLLNDSGLMVEMLAAGGAAYGEWGNAAKIFHDIQKASPRASDGVFRRLAIATSVAHARPIQQMKPKEPASAPTVHVNPVNRYLHYEKAFLDGELDPAFEHLSAWDLRHVVNHHSPDEILQWGRTMLRNYRPDHIYNPDYGWRYVSSVRTEVPYGSKNVKYDDPKLYEYKNIVRNGGICGRRAFFGRFILRAFGIPTWGVTQRAHAAVGHWTPQGWVVVLGAGFPASWWDKDDTPMSGAQFLQETQARVDAEGYMRVSRARWISRILGEQAYNDRRKIEGGFWSRVGMYQERALAANAKTLGPLGQELAEANEREQQLRSAAVDSADKEVKVENGILILPAVGHAKSSGKSAAMKSFGDGMQLHMLGGFKGDYQIRVPSAGAYELVAQMATVQTGQTIRISVNGAPSSTELEVPYTLGMWETTRPVSIDLKSGTNTITVELVEGSRGVTVKDFKLKAASR